MAIYDGAIDKGLEDVVVCTTSIGRADLDGLWIRGIPIEELVDKFSFEELEFLILNGRQPSKDELGLFQKSLAQGVREIPEQTRIIWKNVASSSVHPLSQLRTIVSSFEKDGPQLLGWVAFFVTNGIRDISSDDFAKDLETEGLASAFLKNLGRKFSEEEVKAFDQALVIHGDHGMNASTFTARVTGSTEASVVASLTAALSALSGPLHGGANEKVLQMLQSINGPVDVWISQRLKEKKLIMGFGHRVHRNGDPRAPLFKKLCAKICKDPQSLALFKTAQEIEKWMGENRKMKPNIDFYSAVLYQALGIPERFFPSVFAMARTAGWLAHIYEQKAHNRLYTPLGRYQVKPGL